MDVQTAATAVIPASDLGPASAHRLDLADLVSLLLAATGPDRDLDLLTDVMLGGKTAHRSVDAARVRGQFWLRDQVQAYTAGREALQTLAHVRGFRITSSDEGEIWAVESRDLSNGAKVTIRHPHQGMAGIIGVALLVARGT